MKTILPFRLDQLLFALDLDKVQEVGSGGKISLIPYSSPPLVGLMQKMGEIFPVWSLFSLLEIDVRDITQKTVFIKLTVDTEIVVLPIDEALSIGNLNDKWIPCAKFGLPLYRFS